MKLMICCSTAFYDKVADVSKYLISNGYDVIYPNGYLDNDNELDDNVSEEEYSNFFKKMFLESIDKVKESDGILVLNYTKNKNGKDLVNYIGASTFLEMYEAFMNNKIIYMLNQYPDNMLLDEIKGFKPIILNGDISNLKRY
jgi:hypothetical protein